MSLQKRESVCVRKRAVITETRYSAPGSYVTFRCRIDVWYAQLTIPRRRRSFFPIHRTGALGTCSYGTGTEIDRESCIGTGTGIGCNRYTICWPNMSFRSMVRSVQVRSGSPTHKCCLFYSQLASAQHQPSEDFVSRLVPCLSLGSFCPGIIGILLE